MPPTIKQILERIHDLREMSSSYFEFDILLDLKALEEIRLEYWFYADMLNSDYTELGFNLRRSSPYTLLHDLWRIIETKTPDDPLITYNRSSYDGGMENLQSWYWDNNQWRKV